MWNCNGIRNKTHRIHTLIEEFNPVVIALTETRLTPEIHDSEILRGYTLYRRDRPSNGGGVLLAVKDDHPIIVTSAHTSSTGELVSIHTQTAGQSNLTFCCYYRPPDKANIDDLTNWIEAEGHNDLVLMGDFNLPSIRWDTNNRLPTWVGPYHKGASVVLMELLSANNLSQHINFPTHNNGNTLDLLISSIGTPTAIVGSEPGLSDHVAVIAEIQCGTVPHESNHKLRPNKHIYQFHKANNEALSDELEKVNAKVENMCTNSNNIQEIWDTFKSDTQTAVQQHIPQRTIKQRKKPWISTDTIRQIRKKRRLYRQYRENPSDFIANAMREQNKRCTRMIDEDYDIHLNTRISQQLKEGNTKPLFKFIGDTRKDNNTIKAMEGVPSDRPEGIPDAFSVAFQSVFTKDDGSLPHMEDEAECDTEMEEVEVNESGILNLLLKLDTRKAGGPDGFTPAMLKFLAQDIAPTITIIMQYSLNTATTPSDWRTANVVPIHKKGSRTVPLNYRPISLTSVICKMLEHVIAHNIRKHLDTNAMISTTQHGFRENHSCESQLLVTVGELVDNFDKDIQTDVIVLDFAKAFDTVSYNKLMIKLKTFKIHPLVFSWIEDWLNNREFSVTVNTHVSSVRDVTSGVPQGSVLGPLLFLLFINDLPSVVRSSQIRLFADDALLFKKIETPLDAEDLQKDLTAVADWADTWQLSLNIKKCEACSISRRPIDCLPPNYLLHNVRVTPVTEFKYLGITISSDLSFDTHIKNIIAKTNRLLYMLIRTLKKCSEETKTRAYFSICRPCLEYASVVWSPHTNKNNKILENVQRKAYRWATGTRRTEHISGVMANKGWEELKLRRKRKDRHTWVKSEAGRLAINIKDHVDSNDTHNTRYGKIRKRFDTDLKKHFFFNRTF